VRSVITRFHCVIGRVAKKSMASACIGSDSRSREAMPRKSAALTNTQAHVSSEATAHAQSSGVTRALGFFSLALNSRNASGSRKSRCVARISRGSHTPA